jgi:hypothetical protein
MLRASGTICAFLAAALAGCVFNTGGTRVDVAVKVDEQALNAAYDATAIKIKAELEKRGLQVTVNQQGNTIRLVSMTKSGEQFAIVLTRVVTSAGTEQTMVRAEWEKVPDKDLWAALILAAGTTVLHGN